MILEVKRLWLYELRTSANLTQGDMAHIMGISSSHYNNIEHGRRGLRGRLLSDHFVTLADYFHISLEQIHKMESIYLSENLS